jgi:hypothetical protein
MADRVSTKGRCLRKSILNLNASLEDIADFQLAWIDVFLISETSYAYDGSKHIS